MSHTNDDSITSDIQQIKQTIQGQRKDSITNEALVEAIRVERQKDQVISKIYETMLIQHSKMRLLGRQKSHLASELDKLTSAYQQLKQTCKKTIQESQVNQSRVSNLSSFKKVEHPSLTDGVYIILHFKNEASFQQSIPFLQDKAQFLSMEEFTSLQDDLERTSRTSSRMELQSSYVMIQLNKKLDTQTETIHRLDQHVADLSVQNSRLKQTRLSSKLEQEVIELRQTKHDLQAQLAAGQLSTRKLSDQLNQIKRSGEKSPTKGHTMIIRR